MSTLTTIAAWLSPVGAVLASAGSLAAQQLPPVHLLDRPVATSRHDFRTVVGVRHLPNGRVLVDDTRRHQVVLLDSTLTQASIVIDSSASATSSYGTSTAPLLRYHGDSSVVVLPRVPSMYLLDPEGKVVRVMSVPRPQDANVLAASTYGIPGFDAQGRLVYRAAGQRAVFPKVEPGGPPQPVVFPDSAPVVRANATTHTLDTITFVHILQYKGLTYPRENGSTYTVLQDDPLPIVDDWAVLSDGSVAILRGRDYHIDFVNPDGTTTKGPRMLYAWEPLTDDAKVAFVDSLKRADSVSQAGSATTTTTTGSAGTASGTSSTGSASGGSTNGGGGMSVRPGGSGERPPSLFPSPQDLPDYRPPFAPNAARADADGNLWIRTTHRGSFGAGDVYDVVNRKGVVVDRVQMQPGRSIIGFGAGGVVYMLAKDDTGQTIEKSLWKAPR